jgi:hypothetical protein
MRYDVSHIQNLSYLSFKVTAKNLFGEEDLESKKDFSI